MLERRIELLAKRHAIKFVLDSLVKAFTNTIGLRVLGLRAGVVDILHREIELIFVVLALTAIFGPAIGQNA